jgi:hypothetical protein
MKPRRGWWRRLVVPLVVCATSVAMVGIAVPSSTAAGSSTGKTVPVQQLSSVVLKLIKTVEGSTLPCQTRNDVVRRLRLLDDALLSGRRSAAVALGSAWRQDAWSMQAARLIGPELGSSIQNRLGRLQGKIGSGYAVKPGPARHWKPLPSCETSPSGGEPVVASGSGVLTSASSGEVVGSYTPTAEDPLADLKVFLKVGIGLLNLVNIAVPGLGTFLSSLLAGVVDLFWPAGTGPDTANQFQDLVDTTTYNQVSFAVNQLGGHLEGTPGGWDQNLAAWQYTCQHEYGGFDTENCALHARDLYQQWYTNYSDFLGFRAAIEKAGDPVKLLPLFAAYDNLFLPFLSQGVQLHQYWKANPSKGWRALDTTLVDGTLVTIPLAAMDDELNPNYVDSNGLPDRGVGYVNYYYKMGLAAQSGWPARNAYIRDMTLNVLDFRDMWKYMDPRVYPNGVPGGVKLTRMIYSDPVGEMQATPNPPRNVAGPLKELSVWRVQVETEWHHTEWSSYYGITSVQATSPPLLGPAQSGAVRGDAAPSLDVNADCGKWCLDLGLKNPVYLDLAAGGPMIAVETAIDRPDAGAHWFPSFLSFHWANGGKSTIGNAPYGSGVPQDLRRTFSFGGEVLATAQVISHFDSAWGWPRLADAIVFGFRYADSFGPTGEVVGVGSGKCIDLPGWTNGSTRAVIHSCYQPPTPAQIWSYDPGLEQISVTNPDEWSDTDPTKSGKHCLDTAGGGTTTGTQVVINRCDDGALSSNGTVSSQRWTLKAAGVGAKITNVKSGLVIDVPGNVTTDGTQLQLAPYVPEAAGQQWHARDPLTGELHGIGSGRCVMPNGPMPGARVGIYDCTGVGAQQWSYNPTTRALTSAAPLSLCLEASGGGTTAGAAVVINTCTGATEQKWTLHGNGGTITNDKSGLLLSVVGTDTANGTLLNLNTANDTANQLWSRTSSQGGAVHSLGAAGKCLDLPASTWTNGTQAVIRSCATPLSASQTWTYHQIAQTFTVNSPSGAMCLDAAGGATDENTAVVINYCTPDAASQKWSLDPASSTVTNVKSGLLLDVTEGGTTDGTPVRLTPQPTEVDAQGHVHLLPPTSSQQWVWSLS